MSDATSPIVVLDKVFHRLFPPSVSHLAAFLRGSESFPDFVRMIREYLPESETDILLLDTIGDQIAEFGERFSLKYFPLDHYITSGDADTYDDLLTYMPIEVGGIDSYAYHEMPQQGTKADLVMCALVEEQYLSDGARIAIIEKCAEFISREMLEKIPEGGFTLRDLELCLTGTPYEPLIMWSRMLNHETGNFFLDTEPEELTMSYGHGSSGDPQWDPETVEFLTGAWKEAEVLWADILKLEKMIEEDPQVVMFDILMEMLGPDGVHPLTRKQPNTLLELLKDDSETEGGELCQI